MYDILLLKKNAEELWEEKRQLIIKNRITKSFP